MEKITSKSALRYLLALTLFLILINVTVFAVSDLQMARIVRLLSLLLFLGYYIYFSGFEKGIVLYILGVFVLRDVTLLFYETEIGHSVYLIFGIIAYGLICLERRNIVKDLVYNINSLVVTVLIIVANTYTLYELSRMIQENYIGPFEPVLFYIYGGLMILLGATAINYNQNYNSNRSLMYVFFAICFIVSDVTALFAYYFGIEFLFFIERSAFLLGFGFFIDTALDRSQQLEELEQYKLLSSDK